MYVSEKNIGNKLTQGSFWWSLAGANIKESHSFFFVNGSARQHLIANIRLKQEC